MWTHYNPNPAGRNVGDCTVRALSKALNQDWYTTYLGLCVEGGLMGDMPSANATWGHICGGMAIAGSWPRRT